jgi:hypothetical protein
LCAGFRAYWEQHGGLAIFGYPISEEFVEDGLVVQYFERQRFEYHPTNPPEWPVLGGRLGAQLLDRASAGSGGIGQQRDSVWYLNAPNVSLQGG